MGWRILVIYPEPEASDKIYLYRIVSTCLTLSNYGLVIVIF
jgi:hypothetical protein